MKTTETAVAPEKKQGFFQRELSQWFGNVVGDLWGGAVTTFALLPEVIGFMIVVGVHPYMGLFTCICLTVLLAFIMIVIEPPQPTEARSPMRSSTSFFASSPPAAL